MRLLTKRSLIHSVAERYRAAYQRRSRWLPAADGSSAEATYARLKALPAGAREEDVAAIAGDARWTANLCDECGEDREVLVVLGEEPHHATDAFLVCTSCLQQALHLAEQAEGSSV
jgi:hypothetical protein